MEAEVKIEKGIRLTNCWNTIGPFADMDVGDSFVIPDSTKARSAVFSAGRSLGRKFSCRKVGDAIRIWRVA